MPWLLRSAEAEDAEAVVALWLGSDAAPTMTDDPVSVRALIAHDPEALIVAVDSGERSEIVGTLIAGFDGWRSNLYRLVVHPRARRRGLAGALVAEAERRLSQRGAPRANALVVLDHPHAVGFWESAGYERDDRMGRWVKTLRTRDDPRDLSSSVHT